MNRKKPPPIEGRFVSLGTYRFEKTGQSFVIVATEDTTGHVTADAVTFIPADAATAPKPGAGDAVRKMEAELKRLVETGLVTQERSSRFIIYRAAFDRMNALLGYLTENCCQGGACAVPPPGGTSCC